MLYTFYFLAMLIGTCQASLLIYHLAVFFHKHLFRRQLDLSARYGRGSWAVVTGASDGIGAAYCEELASQGFNIALVSRTKAKLEAVEKKCKAAGVQTRLVVADFSNAARAKENEVLGFY